MIRALSLEPFGACAFWRPRPEDNDRLAKWLLIQARLRKEKMRSRFQAEFFAHRPRDLLGGESNVFCQSDAGIAIKAKEEFRTPSDGNAYSWEEFVTFFGKDYGLIAWARCRQASPEEKHRALLARLRQHVMRLHARLHAKFFLRAAGHRLDGHPEAVCLVLDFLGCSNDVISTICKKRCLPRCRHVFRKKGNAALLQP